MHIQCDFMLLQKKLYVKQIFIVQNKYINF